MRTLNFTLYAIIFTVAAFAPVPSAYANPEGATVQSGTISISETGPKLDVYQSTNKGIIDWRKFSIGAGEETEFHQPSSSSFTLNRVTTNSPSEIAGKLTANGNVIIINPNGIVFDHGSVIDVNGLVATTSNISNDDFNAGRMNFSAVNGASPDAKVANYGTITAREAGLVGLVAPNVENHGLIQAKLGRVALAAGDKYTLDLAGDNLIKIDVTDKLEKANVFNDGKISADGGIINISAADAREFVNGVVTNTGEIEAKSVGDKQGKVTIDAGHGKVENDGKIDVSGKAAGEKGGDADVFADDIELDANTVIDASGDTGGGNIRVGGGRQGKDTSVHNAQNVTVAKGALLNSNAITNGNGGNIIVWSDDTTKYYGMITARGGDLGGNGGFAETSGKLHLFAHGGIDTRAPNGIMGEYLLDPADISIFSDSSGQPTDQDSTFLTSEVEALLGGSTLTLSANNSITLNFGGDSLASTGLTLNAPTITDSSAGTFSGDINLIGTSITLGQTTFLGTINATGNSDISINSSGDLFLGEITAGSSLTITSSGNVSLTGTGTVGANNGGATTTITAGGNFNSPGAYLKTGGSYYIYSTSRAANNNYYTLGQGFTNQYNCTAGCSLNSSKAFGYSEVLYLSVDASLGVRDTAYVYGDDDHDAANPDNSTRDEPNFGYTISGWANGDDGVDNITGPASAGDTYVKGQGAGTNFDLTTSGNLASSMGYVFNYNTNSGVGVVGKRVLTATIDDSSSTYGQDPNLHLGAVNFGNFYSTETVANLTNAPVATVDLDQNANADVYTGAVYLHYTGDDANYDYSAISDQAATHPVTATHTIDRAVLVASVMDQRSTYGDDPYASFNGITYTGWQNSDNTGSLVNQPTANLNGLTSSSNAGTYSSYVTLTDNGPDTNYTYDLSTAAADAYIDKKLLSVSIDPSNSIYGQDPTAHLDGTIHYSNFANGETETVLSGTPTLTTALDSTATAGTHTGAVTLTGGSETNYEYDMTATGNMIVAKKMLSGTIADSSSQYGDDPNANLNPIVFSGFENSETDTVLQNKPTSYVASLNQYSGAGSTSTVTAYNNGDDSNYDYSDIINYTTATHTITKRPLTVTFNAPSTSVYGDDPYPTFNIDYSNFANSQTAANLTDHALAHVDNLNAGIRTASFDENASADQNYDFVYVGSTAVHEITKKMLTPTFATSENTIYGDDPSSNLPALYFDPAQFAYSDTEASLSSEPTAITSYTATTGAGTYSGAITLTGGTDSNYDYNLSATTSLIVGKKMLSGTIADSSSAYGDDPNANLNPVVFSGFVNSETDAVLVNKPTSYVASLSQYTGAGTTGTVTASNNGDDSNYDYSYIINYTTATHTIDRRQLAVTFSGPSTSVYGDDPYPTFNIAYSNFGNGETAANLSDFAAAHVDSINAGTRTASFDETPGSNANYEFVYSGSTASHEITRKMLTPTFMSDENTTYGDDPLANLPGLYFDPAQFAYGETDANLVNKPTATTTYTATTGAGTYGGAITLTGSADNNYDYDLSATASLIVGKKMLIGTIADSSSQYGDDPNANLNPIVFSGFVNSETDAVLANKPTSYVASLNQYSNAGSTGTVTAYNNGDDSNYDYSDILNYTTATHTIDRRQLAVTFSAPSTSVYGDDPYPTFNIAYSNFGNGENSAYLTDYAAAHVDNLNAGTRTASFDETSGSNANYEFVYSGSTASHEITKKLLTPTFVSDENTTYGDDPLANLPGLYFDPSQFAYSDTDAVLGNKPTATTTYTTTTGAGTYAGGITLTGGSDSNYDYDLSATASLIIAKKMLSGTIADSSSAYGDDPNAYANPIVFDGFVNGETDTVLVNRPSSTVALNQYSTAGSTGTVTAYNNGDDANYDYSDILSTTAANHTITRRELAVTLGSSSSTYGEDPSEHLNIQYSNFANGETYNNLQYQATGYTDSLLAGTTTARLNETDPGNTNYEFTYSGSTASHEIAKKVLRVYVADSSSTYGDDPSLYLSTPTFEPSDYVYGDTDASLSNKPTAATALTGATDAGTYTGAVTLASTGLDSNYEYDLSATATHTIDVRSADIGVQSHYIYGDSTPTSAVNVSGNNFANSDDYTNYNPNNYTINYTDAGTTIDPRLLYITISDSVANSVYGEDPSSYYQIYYSNFAPSESVGNLSNYASATIDGLGAGTHTVTLDNTITSINPNYVFDYSQSSQTATHIIDKKQLTTSLDDITTTYGDDHFAALHQPTFTGFEYGETDAVLANKPTATTGYVPTSTAGVYNGGITLQDNGLDSNYSYDTTTTATLTIGKKMLSGTIADSSSQYGDDPNANLNPIVFDGFVNGETDAVLVNRPASFVASLNQYNGAGTTGTVTAYNNGDDANYDYSDIINYTTATHTIDRRQLAVTFIASSTSVYGDDPYPTFNIAYSNFGNGETAANLSDFAAAHVDDLNAGTRTASFDGTSGSNANYEFVYSGSTASHEITKKLLTPTFVSDENTTYGDDPLANLPGLYFDPAQFAYGETDAVLVNKPTATTTYTVTTGAGTYAGGITLTGSADNNYDYDLSATASLIIAKKMLSGTIADSSSQYGDDPNANLNPIVFSGFVNTETDAVLANKPTSYIGSLNQYSTAGTTGTVTAYNNGDDSNYDYSDIINYTTATHTIDRRQLAVTFSAPSTSVYGDDPYPTFNIAYSNFGNGETAANLSDFAAAHVDSINAGTRTASFDETPGSNANYEFVYSGSTASHEITRKMLTPTFMSDENTTYGDDPLANLPGLYFDPAQFAYGETDANLVNKPTATTTYTATTGAGTYGGAITLTGSADNNYDYDLSATASLIIAKKMLSGTIADSSSQYGDDPNANLNPIVFSGFVNSETDAVLANKPTSYVASLNQYNGAGTTGTVTAYNNGDDSNYDYSDIINYTTATHTIDRRQLAVTFSASSTSVYGDDPYPTFNIAYSNFGNGETAANLSDYAAAHVDSLNAGTRTASFDETPGSNANYEFVYSGSTASHEITRKLLTPTFMSDENTTYGDDPLANLPGLYFDPAQFAYGETDAVLVNKPTATTTYTATTGAGTYAGGITLTGSADSNYDYDLSATASLIIAKKMLSGTIADSSSTYGDDPNANLNPVVFSGFVNGETDTVLANRPTPYQNSLNQYSSAGSTGQVTASNNGDDSNYDYSDIINYTTATHTIDKRQLTVTFSAPSTSAYGEDPYPYFNIDYSNFANGETAANLSDHALAHVDSLNAGARTASFDENASADQNYDFIYVGSTAVHTITKKLLTISVDDSSSTYGQDPSQYLGAVHFSGFEYSDDENSLANKPTAATTLTAASNADTYAGGVTLANNGDDSNYDYDFSATATHTINKKLLTATIADSTSVYGDPVILNSPAFSGFENGQDESYLSNAPTSYTSQTNVGTGMVNMQDNGLDTNYEYDLSATAMHEITKRHLTATLADSSSQYGDDPNAYLNTPVFGNFAPGENETYLSNAPTAHTDLTNYDIAGTTGSVYLQNNGTDGNYDYSDVVNNFVTATHTIDKRQLTVTFSAPSTSVYGDDPYPYFNIDYSNFANGETAANLTDHALAHVDDLNAGTRTASFDENASADQNYDFVYVGSTAVHEITRKMLTPTFVSDENTTYGDDPSANLPGLYFDPSQFAYSDTDANLVNKPAATTTYTATTGAGTYAGAITLTGSADSNYDYDLSATASLIVGKKTLSGTIADSSSQYGDDPNSYVNPIVFDGFVNGETDAVLQNKPVSYITSLSQYNGAGSTGTVTAYNNGDDPNYDYYEIINYTSATHTITKRQLNVNIGDSSSTYGNDPVFNIQIDNYANSEDINSLSYVPTASLTDNNVNAGVHPVALDQNNTSDNSNYEFVYGTTTANHTIDKRTVYVTSSNSTGQYGDDPSQHITLNFSNFGYSDSEFDPGMPVAQVSSYYTANLLDDHSHAGDAGNMELSINSTNNYDFSFAGPYSYTITPRDIHVHATGSHIYGDNALNLTIAGDFVNGDIAETSISGYAVSTDAQLTDNAGTGYTAQIDTLGTSTDYNLIDDGPSTYTIYKRNLAITPDSGQHKIYGSADPASYTYTLGTLYNGDDDSVILGNLTRAAGSNAGTYAIQVGSLDATNYNLQLGSANFTIDKAALIVTAADKTKTYGDVNPGLTGTITGYVNSENSSALTTAPTYNTSANTNSDVGHYAILGSGALATNYTFNYVAGDLNIGKKQLTATIDNAGRTYGDNNPAFTAQYTGFVLGQNAGVIDTAPTYISAANATANIGSYAITGSGGLDNNYSFAFNNGTLTIGQAALDLSVDNKTKYTGQANPAFTFTLNGLKNSDTNAVISGLNLASIADASSAVGSYAITVSGGTALNYYISAYHNGLLSVTNGVTVPVAQIIPNTVYHAMNDQMKTIMQMPPITFTNGFNMPPIPDLITNINAGPSFLMLDTSNATTAGSPVTGSIGDDFYFDDDKDSN